MRFDYSDRVNVERSALTEDAYGTTQVRTWAVLHRHLPCYISMISGAEAIAYNTAQATVSHMMSCAWIQIRTSDRIIWGDKKLNVVAVFDNRGVRGAGRSLKLVLSEVKGRGE